MSNNINQSFSLKHYWHVWKRKKIFTSYFYPFISQWHSYSKIFIGEIDMWLYDRCFYDYYSVKQNFTPSNEFRIFYRDFSSRIRYFLTLSFLWINQLLNITHRTFFSLILNKMNNTQNKSAFSFFYRRKKVRCHYHERRNR